MPGGLGWTPVTLELPDAHWLTDLTDWAGGFTALEGGKRIAPGSVLPAPQGVFPRYVEPEAPEGEAKPPKPPKAPRTPKPS